VGQLHPGNSQSTAASQEEPVLPGDRVKLAAATTVPCLKHVVEESMTKARQFQWRTKYKWAANTHKICKKYQI
jgi:hypothetical protein